MSNQLPDDWEYKCLSELSSLITKGATPSSYGFQYVSKPEQGGVKFIRGNNATISGKFNTKEIKYICNDAHQYLKRSQLKNGDVIISIVGSIGTSLFVDDNVIPANINQNVALIRPNQRIDNRFLLQVITSPIIQKLVALEATTQAQPSLSLKQIGDFVSPVPSLPEQQKIAAILTSVDDVIEKTQAQINKLKDLKTGMIQELLTRGVGIDGKPHTEFKDSPVGRIPKRWDCCLLDRVAKRGSGHTPDKQKSEYWNGGIKWVSLTDSSKLDKLHLHKTSKEISQLGIDNSSATLHPSGTVVMTRDAGIGKSAIIQSPMAVSQHFMAWVCSDKLDNYFLYYLLQYWKPKFENIAMGSTIKTIGLPFFKKLQIPLPSIDEQKIIAKSLKAIESNIFKLEEKNTKNQAIKKALMQDLLTGKVRVNVD